MHPFILKSSIAGLSLLAFSTVHAQSATSALINFTGRLTHTTCTVAVSDREQTIDFNEVPATTDGFENLNIGGTAKPAYTKPVEITLENCSATQPGGAQPSAVRVSVTGPDVVMSTGRLKTSHAALNIQLLEGASDNPWNLANRSQPITLAAGSNVLKFKARYYLVAPVSTSTSTALATASATFNMHYN